MLLNCNYCCKIYTNLTGSSPEQIVSIETGERLMLVVKVWLAGSLHRVDRADLVDVIRASIAAEMSSPGSVRGFNPPTKHAVDLDEVVILETSRIFQEYEAL